MLFVRCRFAEVQWPNRSAMVATSTVKAKASEGIWEPAERRAEPASLDKGIRCLPGGVRVQLEWSGVGWGGGQPACTNNFTSIWLSTTTFIWRGCDAHFKRDMSFLHENSHMFRLWNRQLCRFCNILRHHQRLKMTFYIDPTSILSYLEGQAFCIGPGKHMKFPI